MTDSSKKSGDGSENWTEKRIHNTNYFRSAALVGAVAIAGYSTSSSSSSTGRVAISEQASAILHLVSFGTGLGTMMYTTFVLGITMFQALPRRTFGLLQAQLFPRYFTLCSCTLLVQIFTLRALSAAAQKSKLALYTALTMTLLNQFYLEPKATANMMERYRLEDGSTTTGDEKGAAPKGIASPEYKKLKTQFGMLHGLSSLANLIALCGSMAHAVFLAPALVVDQK